MDETNPGLDKIRQQAEKDLSKAEKENPGQTSSVDRLSDQTLEAKTRLNILAEPDLNDAELENTYRRPEKLRALNGREIANLKINIHDDSITKEQRELVMAIQEFADRCLAESKSQNLSPEEREKRLVAYGRTMDQLSTCLPINDYITGKDKMLQQAAVHELEPYYKLHPNQPDINQHLFMLYHHGALVDKDISALCAQYQVAAVVKNEPIDMSREQQYSKQFVNSEMRAKVYLENYVRTQTGHTFFLDTSDGYLSVFPDDVPADDQEKYTRLAVMEDIFNWYTRTALFQNYSDSSNGYINFEKAKALAEKYAFSSADFDQLKLNLTSRYLSQVRE